MRPMCHSFSGIIWRGIINYGQMPVWVRLGQSALDRLISPALGLIYRQYYINFRRWCQRITCSDILS